MTNNMKRKSFLAGKFLVLLILFVMQVPVVQAMAAKGVAINAANFPDANFREYILTTIDTDDDEVLSDDEIASTFSIKVEKMSISDLTGIEYFTEVTNLSCGENPIQSLDLSKNKKLYYIWCSFSDQLTSLVVSSPVLKSLMCQKSGLETIDITECPALEELWISENKLTSLDIRNNLMLEELVVADNQITSLDVSKHQYIKVLLCANNQLTTLDVSSNKALTSLSCSNNQLTVLDISNNLLLEDLSCENNQLKEVDISQHKNLLSFMCSKNHITYLDFSNNPKLEYVSCAENPIIFFDVSECASTIRCYFIDGELGRACDPTLLKGFDPSKISNLSGATYNADSNKFVITWNEVSFYYDCGFGNIYRFRFLAEHADLDNNGECDLCKTKTKITIDKTTFPDDAFRNYILKEIDKNKDGILDNEEISKTTAIEVQEKGISDLTGLAVFDRLEYLNCSDNKIATLDVSICPRLQYIYCDGNMLKELDVSSLSKLKQLTCSSNELTKLDVSNNTEINTLRCTWNQLTTLDVRNLSELRSLECSRNQLTELYLGDSKKLRDVSCIANQLTSLDVSKNTSLEIFHCNKNQLTTLDVSNNINLYNFICAENPLTTLDLTNNTKLGLLDCRKTNIASLDLTKNTALTEKKLYIDECEFKISDVITTFSLSEIPNFDVSKASGWKGAVYNSKDNTLTALKRDVKVTYDYDCGNGYVLKGTIAVAHLDDNKDLICDGCGFVYGYAIDEVNFPDSNFRKYVMEFWDLNADRVLTEEESSEVVSMSLNDYSITTLKGIEYFKNLEILNCSYNPITELDLSKNINLVSLSCFRTELTSLNLSKNVKLEYLYCHLNKLTELNVTNCKELKELWCRDNQLTELDVTNNTALTELMCNDNQLTALDVSKNKNLKEVYLYNNRRQISCSEVFSLSSLPGFDASKASGWMGAVYNSKDNTLTDVGVDVEIVYRYDCGNGQVLSARLIPSHLDENNDLKCDGCNKILGYIIDEATFPDPNFRKYVLDNIDSNDNAVLDEAEFLNTRAIEVSNSSITDLKGIEYFKNLTFLDCSKNQIKILNLNKNVLLQSLYCDDNKLKGLNITKNTELISLSCDQNELMSLNVSKNKALQALSCCNNAIKKLDVSNNKELILLLVSGNKFTSVDVTNNTKLEYFSIENQ